MALKPAPCGLHHPVRVNTANYEAEQNHRPSERCACSRHARRSRMTLSPRLKEANWRHGEVESQTISSFFMHLLDMVRGWRHGGWGWSWGSFSRTVDGEVQFRASMVDARTSLHPQQNNHCHHQCFNHHHAGSLITSIAHHHQPYQAALP